MVDRALRQRILTIRLAIITIAILSVARLLPHPSDAEPVIAELPAADTYSYVMTTSGPLSAPRALHIRSGRWVAEAPTRPSTLAPAAPAVVRYRVESQ
jgi:hypothetical protein